MIPAMTESGKRPRGRKRQAAEAAIDFLGDDYSRFVLVANNPILGKRSFDRLAIGADDLVVQFNTCMHFDALADRPGFKGYAVNRTITQHIGFHADGQPLHPFTSVPSRGSAMIFVTGDAPRPEDPVTAWLGREADRIRTIVPQPQWARSQVPDYPEDKRLSTGFSFMMLLRWVNAARAAEGLEPTPIHLVGFTSHGIPMHGWDYERRWLKAHPEVVRHHEPLRGAKTFAWWLFGKKLAKLRRAVTRRGTEDQHLPIGRA
jgi:hypothetical protein